MSRSTFHLRDGTAHRYSDRRRTPRKVNPGCEHDDGAPPVIPSYTQAMKTAISVPDETFEKASRRAHELGVSRSEFFSRAAARYVDELDAESITEQINQAVETQTRRDDSASAAVAAGHRVLDDGSDEW